MLQPLSTTIGPPRHGTVQNRRAWTSFCINTIRTLAIDAVQQANSGHPGIPMALAPVVYTLRQSFLRFAGVFLQITYDDPADQQCRATRTRSVSSRRHAANGSRRFSTPRRELKA